MYRNIKLFGLFNFFVDLRFYSAILVVYFAKVTDSYFLAMSLFATVMISSAIFEVPTGIFSDMIGRKKTIILGAIFAFMATIMYAVGQNYWLLFIGAIFEGMSRSWYSGNNEAYLHDLLTENSKEHLYDEYLGKTSSMFQVALVIGAVIGSIIAAYSFGITMWLSTIPAFICIFIALMMTDVKKYTNKSANIFSHLKFSAFHLWRNKKLRLLSIGSIAGYGIGESTFNFRSAFVATLWPVWAIGFSNMLSNIGASLSYWFSGKLIRKFGDIRLLFISNIYGRFIGLLATGIPTILSPALLATTSLFYGVKGVAESKLMQNEYTQEQRATLESLNSLLGKLFYGVFALFVGFVADRTNPAIALFISQICSIPTLFIYWYLLKSKNKTGVK